MRGRSPAPGRLARLLAWRPYHLRTTIVLVALTLACAATSAVMFLRGGTIEDGWPILLAVVAGFLVVPTALVIRDDGFGTWSGGGRDHSPYVVDTTPVHHDGSPTRHVCNGPAPQSCRLGAQCGSRQSTVSIARWYVG